MELTEKDKSVFAVISSHNGSISPTYIGMELGKSYNSASSFCNPSLKETTKCRINCKDHDI